ncbi:hypothetical protein SMACR_04107 [Sordaria macrospora]|uniref:cutinase n=1 Tax=Sordaria macrospora TaxID=5147 RepID=A0A8S8ZK85_SORMA|nr:hypothetical protein SMACR_04107 [Sordaria macrospora]
MKSFVALSLAALALANPIPVSNEPAILAERQTQTGITSTEFTRLGCRPVIFLFARGSTEIGNMGSTVGPPTSNGIKAAQGVTNVVTEGIDYPALLSTNFLPGGADLGGISEMKRLLNKAATECPNSKIVVSGYRYGHDILASPQFSPLNTHTNRNKKTAKAQPSSTAPSRACPRRSRTRSWPP